MLTFDKFTGINNVLPTERLKPTELTTAMNVDIGLDGEISRRAGYSVVDATCHKNLWQANGFMLATTNGDLKKVGGATLYPSLGVNRVWYCNLPDGRTAFSNGLINGLTDGVTTTGLGIPVPASIGTAVDTFGSLDSGNYQYQITYVRLVDGLEGGPAYSNPVPVVNGGLTVTALPVLSGYKINVYVTSCNGEEGYLAGSTTGASFSYTGKNADLALPCRTDNLSPAPVGTIMVMWRGRLLIVDGSTLWASRTFQYELFDLRRDYKQFPEPITLVQPVDDGLYVGTSKMLYFLSGTEFDKLQLIQVMRGTVVLGSGVSLPGKKIKVGDGLGHGEALICIVDGYLVAGFQGGQVQIITEGRYKTNASEVWATYREINGVPQYVAVPQ